jgi:membrane-bound serine protease (ClpP class)
MPRWIRAVALIIAGATLSTLGLAAGRPGHPQGFVARITLDGPIGPASAEYVQRASERAIDDGARAIILQMDTPGGLAASMRRIVSGVLASPIPVIGYVAPDGARAASAGTYILYACHVAAMAPATHLGAATPVSLGGETPAPAASIAPAASAAAPLQDRLPGGAERRKVLNDSIAYIRSLAQLRGRNAEWAEQAVRGAATLTASEALDRHVVDLVAADDDALLAAASGRSVNVHGQTRTLALKGLPIHDYTPDWRSRFLGVITNPTIAYMLLLAGIYGLILEAFHPGAMLPGIAGGICLLVGLYALQLLPVNYAGLALMALGIGLLVAEIITPTMGALGIGGIIAFVIGSVMLMNTDVPGYSVNIGVIAGLAVSAFGLLALILWLVMRSRRTRPFAGQQQIHERHGELLEALAEDGEAWARVGGERWRVRSNHALPAGARVRVTRREGMTLWVTGSGGDGDNTH